MSTQAENSQNTEDIMSLEQEPEQEPEQEENKSIIEITKEELITTNAIIKKTEENNDKNLYYSPEDPGYRIVKLPGLYPFKVSKPMKNSSLRRMTTTWPTDDDDDNDTFIDFDYFDDVNHEHSIEILQSLISTKFLENKNEN
jgi:hypothetical protein